MIRARLNQITSPADIHIIKYYSYLYHTARKRALTSQESDMLNGEVHHHELCRMLYKSTHLRPWFTDPLTMHLNMKNYIIGLSMPIYRQYPPKELPSAVKTLLQDAYSKLYTPINGLYTCLINTPYGDVIQMYDGIERISIEALDRKYIGFFATFQNELLHGLSDAEAIQTLENLILHYHIPDDEQVCKHPKTNYPMMLQLFHSQAEIILYQFKYRLGMITGGK